MTPRPSQPDVTVLIPAWRAEATVAAAIRSATGQGTGQTTHPDGVAVEVVVVDDASPDGTSRVVQGLAAADPRIRLIRRDWNGGAGAARNDGLAAARGRWIALLDADDSFAPGRLSRLLEAARAARADMVADNLVLVAPGGAVRGTAFSEQRLHRVAALGAPAFIDGNRALRYGYSLGFLKPLVDAGLARRAGPFATDLPVAEDFHWYLDCLLAGGRWRVVPDALYRYTLTPGSLSRSLSIADVEAIRSRGAATIAKVQGAGNGGSGGDPAVLRALARRQTSIELMLAHMRFIQALKDGAAGRALGVTLRRPGVVPYIVKFGLEGAVKRIARTRPHPAG